MDQGPMVRESEEVHANSKHSTHRPKDQKFQPGLKWPDEKPSRDCPIVRDITYTPKETEASILTDKEGQFLKKLPVHKKRS